LLGMCAAWFCRVPVRMHTVAGLPLMEKEGFLFKLLIVMEKLTYIFSTSVYPNSKGLLEYIHQNISRDKKIQIIGKGTSNGIDLNFFNPSELNASELEILESKYALKGKLVFVFVGRVVKDKGVVETVTSFVRLNKIKPDTVLLLVGPLEPELDPIPEEILNEIEAHPNIHAVGYQEDVRPYIAVSNILVFPSYREGFPNVPLQCGAFKKALILSDINGCNEIVEDKKSGLLVPVKDSEALYNAMNFLSENESLRNEYGLKAYEFIEKSFKQEAVWKAIGNEYEQQLLLLT